MPDTVIEMQSGPSTSRTFATSERGADGMQWTSATTSQGQSGAQFDFPGFTIDNNSSFGPMSASMFPKGPTTSSSNDQPSTTDPPSYKEAVFGESDVNDPLLKPVPSAPQPQETQSDTRRDESSLIVRDSGAMVESDATDKDACFILGVRMLVVVGLISGIGLVLWENQFQASAGPDPDRMTRKQFHVRQGFGWTFIVLALIVYFMDGYMMMQIIDEWNSKDLPGHLEKVKRDRQVTVFDLYHRQNATRFIQKVFFYGTKGTPKLTWYMTTFNRDTSTVVITNADGSMRTDERNDQITTWSGTQQFHFSKWTDVTPDQTDILGSINKITFHSKFVLAGEATERAYDAEKQAFIDANKGKGQDYSINEIFEIEGFEKQMTATGDGTSSVLTNPNTLWLMLLTFGFYFWVCSLSDNERKVNYTHIKELSV